MQPSPRKNTAELQFAWAYDESQSVRPWSSSSHGPRLPPIAPRNVEAETLRMDESINMEQKQSQKRRRSQERERYAVSLMHLKWRRKQRDARQFQKNEAASIGFRIATPPPLAKKFCCKSPKFSSLQKVVVKHHVSRNLPRKRRKGQRVQRQGVTPRKYADAHPTHMTDPREGSRKRTRLVRFRKQNYTEHALRMIDASLSHRDEVRKNIENETLGPEVSDEPRLHAVVCNGTSFLSGAFKYPCIRRQNWHKYIGNLPSSSRSLAPITSQPIANRASWMDSPHNLNNHCLHKKTITLGHSIPSRAL